MNVKVIVLMMIVVVIGMTTTFVFAENTYHLHHNTECFDMGKIPKVDKFGDNGYIVSCIGINPFDLT